MDLFFIIKFDNGAPVRPVQDYAEISTAVFSAVKDSRQLFMHGDPVPYYVYCGITGLCVGRGAARVKYCENTKIVNITFSL